MKRKPAPKPVPKKSIKRTTRPKMTKPSGFGGNTNPYPR